MEHLNGKKTLIHLSSFSNDPNHLAPAVFSFTRGVEGWTRLSNLGITQPDTQECLDQIVSQIVTVVIAEQDIRNSPYRWQAAKRLLKKSELFLEYQVMEPELI